MSGVYGRDHVDDEDDDCDDDDDDDDDDDCDDGDDGDGDGDDDKPKWQNIFGGFGHQLAGGRRFGHMTRENFGRPCVKRVYIWGTGEMITIVFRSDHRRTRRGFDAVYRISQGNLFKKLFSTYISSTCRFPCFEIRQNHIILKKDSLATIKLDAKLLI